ncbi:PilT/PilU family type 4a pilus ATPase [Budviciaceae bacterium BWR-B9]|uniref:PilT/PilU family type 4a pilus ATPase n=1 Tax=Limnobaculum allomyrinae TaxID=2791986 RepID=A0ABS1IRN7_9GAMM|nr:MULTISPECIES: PilT/PilU family type 4a pilus ATPase [Limnobaculum]MBK5144420.1 PilT/PilU family type 4a pilus ATPase [Limnobaculum allomyrinae]MBV7691835.1 PilT/PilU family type 4a pilus ATPase [Limnobaculum sp. M2-1]
MNVCQLITDSVKQNASDLHLSAGHLPVLRVNGDLHYFGESLLRSEWLSEQLLALLTGEQRVQFQQQRQLDFALTIEDIRLRVNLFQQCDGISAALRFIRNHIPPPESLGIPDSLIAMSNCQDGLVIVAGATGSGKSTTLAALTGMINQQSARHIITLEDPIEFIHHSQRCLIQQREVGRHVDSFSQGLRAALRQDPDIILLGELRDVETIHMALTAAETGHLVFATLHTRSAVQSIERIIDVFPAEEKRFVSSQLANSLQAVVCQQLLPCTKGGRIAAYEVLVNTPAVSNMIREGKHHQLLTLLQTGAINGMQTMEQCRSRLLSDGLIIG